MTLEEKKKVQSGLEWGILEHDNQVFCPSNVYRCDCSLAVILREIAEWIRPKVTKG